MLWCASREHELRAAWPITVPHRARGMHGACAILPAPWPQIHLRSCADPALSGSLASLFPSAPHPAPAALGGRERRSS